MANREERPVMVLHDDAAIRDALRFALVLEGVQVRAHGSGAALLGDPQLADCACLVLRYHLPDIDGLDGLEVLRRIRAQALDMPAILLTNKASPALQAKAAAAGGALVLEKPIMDDALVSAVLARLAG